MTSDQSAENNTSANHPEANSQELFLSYFAKDHQRIFGYILSQLPRRSDAEDVFQQTSLVLWQKFSAFDQERDFFPWACGVAFYTVKNFLRVSGRSRLRFNDDLLKVIADERVAADPRLQLYSDMLDSCLQRLNEKDRDLIRNTYSGEKSIKEMAESLGRAVQTVYNRLNQIRRRLAECVDQKLASQS